jgi:hypothetical protein
MDKYGRDNGYSQPKKRVINTAGYGTSEGWVARITYKDKFYYTGHGSMMSSAAEEKGLPVQVCRYFGACIYANLQERVFDNFPIEIDGVDTQTFKDKFMDATEEKELRAFLFGEDGPNIVFVHAGSISDNKVSEAVHKAEQMANGKDDKQG